MKPTFLHSLLLSSVTITPFLTKANTINTVNLDNITPLDGGLSLVIAAGIAYTAKKMHKSKRRIKQFD